MKTLLIIAARGGSKGLKNKNLLKLNNKSLTFITLDKVKNYKFIDKILLTSDSSKILKESDYFKNIIQIKRPKKLALDKSNIFLAVRHAVEELKKKINWVPEVVLLTTPTTPFKKKTHFSRCVKILKSNKTNSVITIREPDYPTYWMMFKKKNIVKNIFKNGNRIKRRQEAPKTFQPAGTVYAFKIEILDELIKKNKIFPLKGTYGVVVPKKESINIDTIHDYNYAKIFKKN